MNTQDESAVVAPAGQSLPPGSDGFIDKDELAKRLGVHPRTVTRMVQRGELPRPCLGDGGGRPRWLWEYVVSYCRKQHERKVQLDRRQRQKLSAESGH